MRRTAGRLVPGVLLCLGIALAARLLQVLEEAALGLPYVEALVLAMLLGAAIRAAWEPDERWRPGIRFSAAPLLEFAVVLLGASLDLGAVLAGGPLLPAVIAAVVVLALVASYGLARAFGLSRRLAILIACGNAICGNSAIAAVAPVIGAEAREVAAAIGFTAILGIAVVLGLPLLAPALGLTATQYGALAGLTVYAVPQVLAATAPFGSLGMQHGTLVKLLRVLMLGPVVLALSVAVRRKGRDAGQRRAPPVLPWFIVGFLLLAMLNSLGLVPEAARAPLRLAAGWLTAVALAALGLGVDLRALARVGPRVAVAVTASLLALAGLALGAILSLGLA